MRLQGNCRGMFSDLVSAVNTEIMKKGLHCGLQSRVFYVARTSFYDIVSQRMVRDPHFLSQERFEWSGNSVMSLLNINWHCCWKFIKISNFEARLQNCEKGLLDSSYLSDRQSAWNNSAPTGPIFMKFGI